MTTTILMAAGRAAAAIAKQCLRGPCVTHMALDSHGPHDAGAWLSTAGEDDVLLLSAPIPFDDEASWLGAALRGHEATRPAIHRLMPAPRPVAHGAHMIDVVTQPGRPPYHEDHLVSLPGGLDITAAPRRFAVSGDHPLWRRIITPPTGSDGADSWDWVGRRARRLIVATGRGAGDYLALWCGVRTVVDCRGLTPDGLEGIARLAQVSAGDVAIELTAPLDDAGLELYNALGSAEALRDAVPSGSSLVAHLEDAATRLCRFDFVGYGTDGRVLYHTMTGLPVDGSRWDEHLYVAPQSRSHERAAQQRLIVLHGDAGRWITVGPAPALQLLSLAGLDEVLAAVTRDLRMGQGVVVRVVDEPGLLAEAESAGLGATADVTTVLFRSTR